MKSKTESKTLPASAEKVVTTVKTVVPVKKTSPVVKTKQETKAKKPVKVLTQEQILGNKTRQQQHKLQEMVLKSTERLPDPEPQVESQDSTKTAELPSMAKTVSQIKKAKSAGKISLDVAMSTMYAQKGVRPPFGLTLPVRKR